MVFGPKVPKTGKGKVDKRVEEVAPILGREEFLDRNPDALPGGQRVAMGRAIVRRPQALLIDEPLSGLDAKPRVQMRSKIERIQHDLKVTVGCITHDLIGAVTIERLAACCTGKWAKKRGEARMDGGQRMFQNLTRSDFLRLSGGALVGAYVLGMAGCGGGETRGGQITLRYANWVAAEAATRKTIASAMKSFEKENSNAKVESVAIPFDQMRQQLLTMSAGGNPPDVMQLNGPWPHELGANGALVDLYEMVGEDYLSDNYEGAIEAGEYQGKLYAAPLSLTPHGFWYNKDLMEQAGLDPDQPPKTMEELDQQMAQIKTKLGPKDIYPIGIDTTKIDYALTQFWPWFFAFNARPLYGGEINFDTPEVGNALRWLRDAVNKGYTPVGQQIKEERELMAKDRIVFKLDGPYMVGILRSLDPDLESDAFYEKFAVTTVPVGANDKSETLADIHQIGISSQAENPEAAWTFAEFLAGSEESINKYQIPYGVIPPLKSDQKGEAFSDPVSQTYINEIFDTMVGGPYGPQYGQAQQFIIQAMQQAALQNTPIEQILEQTEENLRTVYGA